GSGFEMINPSRGDGETCDMNNTESSCETFTDDDNTWGDGTNADRASAGVDAHFGAAKTYDYFTEVHGRNGIFGDGSGVPSRVHYGNEYVNAFWDGQQMTYGDGAGNENPLVELDVAGHEMSHGVTENTAGLEYAGDAGGLNESTSDIFGTMVEFYADSPEDTPDFLIGELIDINGDGTPLRYMDEPSKDGSSFDCWSEEVPGSDPHYSSGVGNHFFFLLANGSGESEYGNSPTCDGSTVTGIGNEKAAAVWFRSDINGDGTPLRYMDEPSKDGSSFDCWSEEVPGSDPHYSSGVGNHFFFLLANGSGESEYGNSPTCDGSTVTGIGNEKAAAVWF